VIGRGRIRHVGRERHALDPAQHFEQFSVLRVSVCEHALEQIRRGIVDDRLLQMQQRHMANLFIAVAKADGHVVGPAADGEAMVLLYPSVPEQHL
jgi:hypothetical protein